MAKGLFVVLAVVGWVCFIPSALAADFDMTNPDLGMDGPAVGAWHARVTPYAWLAGISGAITARGRSVSTSASFLDLVEDSDELVPFMGYAEVGKDRFSIFGDVFYSRLGFTREDTVQTNPVPGLVLVAAGRATLTTELAIAQLAAAYDVIHAQGTAFGLYGGARYWNASADLKLKINAEVDVEALGLRRKGSIALARSGDLDWVDPIIGMRVRQEITPRDEITLLADIGGFGVGSELSWQIFAGYSHDWQIGHSTELALALGYRMLSVDYEEGRGTSRTALDILLHGPLAGLSLRW